MENQKIKIKNALLLNLVILFSISASSQNTESYTGENTKVTLSDDRIDKLTERYNRSHEIHGYRVQIISSSKKDKAKKARSIFSSRYQGYKAYEIYQQPFFIIKVGDFFTKIEAEKLHREIRDEFLGSFVLPDVINPIEQYSDKN